MRTLDNAITPYHLNENFNGSRVVLYQNKAPDWSDIPIEIFCVFDFNKRKKTISLTSPTIDRGKLNDFVYHDGSWHLLFQDPLQDGVKCFNAKYPCQLFLSPTQ